MIRQLWDRHWVEITLGVVLVMCLGCAGLCALTGARDG